MNYIEAKELVKKKIEREPSPGENYDPVIVDEDTIEKDWGWIICYQNKQYLETGNISFALAGNAPYVVNRFSGEVVVTGTAKPLEDYIREYEENLDGNKTT
jgi:hypothetical protein